MTWAYAPQLDHEGDALSLLLSEFEKSTLLQGLVSAGMVGVQEIEGEAHRLLTERSLDTAVGVQLDVIGGIVGESRNGRSDAVYRAFAKGRVLVNLSCGEPNQMLRIVRMVLGRSTPYEISYVPAYPAAFRVSVIGEGLAYPWDGTITAFEVAKQLTAMLTQAASAGVQVGLLYSAAPSFETFTLSGVDSIETSSALGLANDARTAGGHLADVEQIDG